MNCCKKKIVEESSYTRKLREKLQKKLEKLNGKITTQALEQKVLEIHKWIAKNASDRVILRAKTISLFDENQNTAQTSKKILTIMGQLQQDIKKSSEDQEAQNLLKEMVVASQNIATIH